MVTPVKCCCPFCRSTATAPDNLCDYCREAHAHVEDYPWAMSSI